MNVNFWATLYDDSEIAREKNKERDGASELLFAAHSIAFSSAFFLR
jgi:hypothetical protein